MNMLNFALKEGKNISFTPKEAEVAVKFYRQWLTMLDEIAKNPKIIPALQQALYEAIREIENAQSKTKKENAETEENPNKKEWKSFMEG